MKIKILLLAISALLSGCANNGESNFDKYHKNNNKLTGGIKYRCESPDSPGDSVYEAIAKGTVRCRSE
ncbi:hypothetical protein [Morganella morganii]|uniref:hypothetical protein n=1 Tax=Morganella morganii TaxID=582 RepID=UPI002FD8D74E